MEETLARLRINDSTLSGRLKNVARASRMNFRDEINDVNDIESISSPRLQGAHFCYY